MSYRSTALAPATMFTFFTTATICEFLTTFRAKFACFGAISNVAFQGAADATTPSVNTFGVKIQFTHQTHYILYRHTNAKDAANEFCIVPEFLAEHTGETFNGHLVAVFVKELEIVAGVLVGFVFGADNPSLFHPFW